MQRTRGLTLDRSVRCANALVVGDGVVAVAAVATAATVIAGCAEPKGLLQPEVWRTCRWC